MAERTRGKGESLLTGAASNYLALGTNIAIGLSLTPLIISSVGKTGYGIWTLISTFLGYYGLLDLGISSAVQRYVALHKGQGREEALNETISTALAIFFCTGIIITIAAFTLADPVTRFFNVPSEEYTDFKNVFRVTGIAIALSFPTNVLSAIISGHQKFVTLNLVNISYILVRAGLIVLSLYFGAGIVALAIANFAGQVFKAALNYLCYRKIMPSGRIGWKYVRKEAFRKIVYFGGVATVIMVANQMRTALDRIIVGKWVALSAVGVYGLAAQLVEYMMTLVIQGLNVLQPRFANLEGTNDRAEIKKIFKTSIHISSFLSFGCCMGALLFGERLILLWVGPEFTEAKYVLWILSIGFVFDLAQNPGILLMFALNKHHLYAWTIVAEAAAKILLSLLLVSRFGMIGVALGTALPMLVTRIFVQPVYVSRILDISLMDYGRPVLIQMAVAAVVVGAGSYFTLLRPESGTVLHLIGSIGVASLFYTILTIAVIDKEQKKIIFEGVSKAVSSKKVEPTA